MKAWDSTGEPVVQGPRVTVMLKVPNRTFFLPKPNRSFLLLAVAEVSATKTYQEKP